MVELKPKTLINNQLITLVWNADDAIGILHSRFNSNHKINPLNLCHSHQWILDRVNHSVIPTRQLLPQGALKYINWPCLS